MKVLVCIEPPPEPVLGGDVLQTKRDVTFHDNWKQALNYVRSFAQGDDPGHVSMMTVSPLKSNDIVRAEQT